MTLKSVIVAGAALEVYPASLIQFITSTPEILTHFGLRASYFKALNVNSQVGDHPDAKMPTTWREIEYDITARAVVFGAQVKASAGLLNSRLFVDTAKVPGLESELPSVTAMTIRVGGDLDIEIIDDFSISAGASFDKPYSMGRLTKRFFPKASGWGYDFRAGVSYALLSHLDVLVFARYGVVNYKLNPASDSTYTATKAVDSLFGVNGGLRAYW
ncbi:MAG: hypothetical protein JW841_14040 [Deltaproteobacteria bacterium]|nr:hypothetical protein [Deltaproteobacteria bacterium]